MRRCLRDRTGLRALSRRKQAGSAGGDTTPPVISGVTHETIASSSVTITWGLSEPATGVIEYGTTTAYGSSTSGETSLLTFHRQTISGLTAGTLYHYRITSADAAGNIGSYESSVTTSGSPPALTAVTFGPGVAAYESAGGASKENVRMTAGAVGVRFTAHESSQVTRIALPFTNRAANYGAGDGGRYRIGIQPLDGSNFPTGSWVGGTSATEVFDLPIITSPQSFSKAITFAAGPTLVAGTNYAMVMENVHASPDANWSCYNLPYNPAQRDYPLHYGEAFYAPSGATARLIVGNSQYSAPYSWLQSGHAKASTYPSMDILYANGGREGFAGIHAEQTSGVGNVTSSSYCQWLWTHHGASITFDRVGVLAWRISGTTDMTCEVYKNGGSVATGTFLASSDLSTSESAYDWVEATLSGSVSAAAGDAMEVRFLTSAGEYRMQVMLCNESGTATADRMLAMPFVGNLTTRHEARENGSYIYPAWGTSTCLMCYVRLV